MPALSADQKTERVLQALATNPGQWMKRAEIAEAMGVKSLNGTYLLLLEIMTGNGLIEAREVETNTPGGVRWEYRVKS